jgi:Holliday junction resolvasome RuvABC endonuclease subunit
VRFAVYSPQQVRATVAGNGKAKKAEAAIAVALRFPQLRVYLTQDRRWKERFWQNMFDAIALALHHQAAMKPPSRGR